VEKPDGMRGAEEEKDGEGCCVYEVDWGMQPVEEAERRALASLISCGRLPDGQSGGGRAVKPCGREPNGRELGRERERRRRSGVWCREEAASPSPTSSLLSPLIDWLWSRGETMSGGGRAVR